MVQLFWPVARRLAWHTGLHVWYLTLTADATVKSTKLASIYSVRPPQLCFVVHPDNDILVLLAALCEDVAMRLLPRPPSTRNSSSLLRHSSFRPSLSSVARPVTLGTCSVARRRPRSAVGRARCAECWPCPGGRASRCDSVGYNWRSNNRWRCARIVETIGAKQCLNVLMRTDT